MHITSPVYLVFYYENLGTSKVISNCCCSSYIPAIEINLDYPASSIIIDTKAETVVKVIMKSALDVNTQLQQKKCNHCFGSAKVNC